jgi:hypothetical protein
LLFDIVRDMSNMEFVSLYGAAGKFYGFMQKNR